MPHQCSDTWVSLLEALKRILLFSFSRGVSGVNCRSARVCGTCPWRLAVPSRKQASACWGADPSCGPHGVPLSCAVLDPSFRSR